jgi:hypothetical protein
MAAGAIDYDVLIQLGRELANPVRENDFIYAGIFCTRYMVPGMEVGWQGVY